MLELQSLVLSYILPSVFDSVITLALVLAIFKVFRVKNPATRATFLLVPLIKPFLILLDGAAKFNMTPDAPERIVGFSLRLPDPLGLIQSPFKEAAVISYNPTYVTYTIALALMVVVICLAARWVQLYMFFASFREGKELSRLQYPEVYEKLSQLAASFGVGTPKLAVADANAHVPFSVGARRPVIVISERLIAESAPADLEIMLAHELAHIKRKDSALSWLSTIMRDSMFLNPVIHLVYRLVEEEKEKACDRIVLEKVDATKKDIARSLVNLALYYKGRKPDGSLLHPAQAKAFLYKQETLERRVDGIMATVPIKRPGKIGRILRGFAFMLLLYLQIGVHLTINGSAYFLR